MPVNREQPCQDGHDFHPPVVVRSKSRRDFPFAGFVEKEVAVSFCRRCGTPAAYGWETKERLL